MSHFFLVARPCKPNMGRGSGAMAGLCVPALLPISIMRSASAHMFSAARGWRNMNVLGAGGLLAAIGLLR